MATISEDNDEDTPLQVRLNSLATTIGKLGLAVAGLVFGILVIRWVHIPTIYHPYMLSLVIYVISLFYKKFWN